MKKYICLALIAFFGTAVVSTVMAPPPSDNDQTASNPHRGGADAGKNHKNHSTQGDANGTTPPHTGASATSGTAKRPASH